MGEQVDLEVLLAAWKTFQQQTGIGPIKDESHYDYLTGLLDALWDRTKGNEQDPLWGLCDLVGTLAHQYEGRRHKMANATGAGALRLLMQEHNLSPADLPELGTERDVIAVLAGSHKLTKANALSLGKRFHVSPSTFYP